MNFKTTLVLLVLLAIVAGYFFLIDRDSPTTYEYETQRQAADDAEGTPLFDGLSAGDVARIAIDRRDAAEGVAAAIARESEEWFQVEPVRFPLTPASPDDIAGHIADLRWIESFTPAGENGDPDAPTLADLALADPRVAITVTADDDVRHTIRLGKRSSGGRGYVMVDDDPKVYVVGDALHAALLETRVEAWRKKSFETPNLSQLEQIVLRQGERTIAASKIDGRWFLGDAAGQRAGEEALSSLLTSLRSVYVRDFIADAPADPGIYGLEAPRLELSITAPAIDEGQPRRQTLRIGGAADLKQETFYATWTSPQTASGGEPSGVVFTVGKSSADSLSKSIDDLRDPRLVVTEAADVREVRIHRRDGDDLTLQRTPQGWVFGEPKPGFELDHRAAEDLLAALTGARAESYEAMLQIGEQPAVHVELFRGGASAPERVSFFGPRASGDAADTYIALREGETVGYVVPAGRIEKLLAPAMSLRDKTVLQVAPDQLTRVELTQPDGASLVFLKAGGEGEDTAWRLEGQDRFESAELDGLLGALAPLEAASWTTTRQSFEPDTTLTLYLKDGATHTLRVESKTRRAMLDELPIFALSQSFVDRLTAEHRDRLALPLTLEQMESVTLTRGDRAVTLERSANNRYVNGDGAEVDQAMAAGVFDTLAGLRVQRWAPAAPGVAGEAPMRITVEPRDRESRTLMLFHGIRRGHFADDERWFLLSEEDTAKLTAPLADEPAAEDAVMK